MEKSNLIFLFLNVTSGFHLVVHPLFFCPQRIVERDFLANFLDIVNLLFFNHGNNSVIINFNCLLLVFRPFDLVEQTSTFLLFKNTIGR